MDKLVIGLLFVVACLSLLICALIRIIVELINGSNRKPNKNHVSIMCAALCGGYRNEHGDYNSASGGGGVEFYHHQQQSHNEPPQQQYKQYIVPQQQHQQQKQYQPHPHRQQQNPYKVPGEKAAADPIADDLRITFSDVRMTEYQKHGDSRDVGVSGTTSDSDDLLVSGVDNTARITFSDVALSPSGSKKNNNLEESFNRYSQGDDHHDRQAHSDSAGRQEGEEERGLGGRASSVTFFRAPSFMRGGSSRRRSGTTTAAATPPGDLTSEISPGSDPSALSGPEKEEEVGMNEENKKEIWMETQTERVAWATDIEESLENETEGEGEGKVRCEGTNETEVDMEADVQTGVEYHMVDRFSGVSADGEDSLMMEEQRHLDDIARLRSEIRRIELLEEGGLSSVVTDDGMGGEEGGSTHQANLEHESDVVEGGIGGDCGDNHNYSVSGDGKSGRSFFSNPFSRKKKKQSNPLTQEGAYNRVVHLHEPEDEEAFTAREEHEKIQSLHHSGVLSYSATEDQEGRVSPVVGGEEWPAAVHLPPRKKSPMTAAGGEERTKRSVTFQKSASLPDHTEVRERGGAVRPLAIQKSASMHSSLPSSGRKLKVSSNSRSGRKQTRTTGSNRSPPRRQGSGVTGGEGEAVWNSVQQNERVSTIKVGRGNSLRLAGDTEIDSGGQRRKHPQATFNEVR